MSKNPPLDHEPLGTESEISAPTLRSSMESNSALRARGYPRLMELLAQNGHTLDLPRVKQVYSNRDLAMEEISVIGFDMDYTIALYKQEALDEISVEKTLERLVANRGYPDSIFSIVPDPHFAIRGLLIDKKRGTILKLDAGRHVVKALYGFREVDADKDYGYGEGPIRMDHDRFHLIDTLFALPEAFLFAALVDHFERSGVEHPSFEQMFADIRYCIDLAHRDASLKTAILANIDRYITRDDRLAPTLHKLRSGGKKLFLLTNSYWAYTDAVMTFLLDGQMAHYPSWRQYFDTIVTGANKPSFFTGDQPFLKIDASGKVVEETRGRLERHGIYQGGNLRDFEANIPGRGDNVLYVGDHIYGDILKSKKTSFWRTCMIVQEMASELRQSSRIRQELARVGSLESELHRLNQELAYEGQLIHRVRMMLSRLKNGEPPPENGDAGGLPPMDARELRHVQHKLRSSTDSMRRRRNTLVTQLVDLDKDIEANFNPYWGLIFKSRNENSIFASQIDLYADLYTSAVTNFLAYSPLQYFRAPRALMPHEI